jgi:hypothetical protein
MVYWILHLSYYIFPAPEFVFNSFFFYIWLHL